MYNKQVNDVLNHLHVHRQAYHSQSFVGNHCKKILDNFVLTDIIKTHTDHSKYLELFSRFKTMIDLFEAELLNQSLYAFRCKSLLSLHNHILRHVKTPRPTQLF